MIEEKERFLTIEQRGIKNTNDIIEVNQRTKSNTHRIDKLEQNVQDLQKETSVLGEVSAVLKMQSEINLAQTKHAEKLDEMLNSQNQNLTELKFITQQLQKTQDKLVEENEATKIDSKQIIVKIFWGLVALVPASILAWIKFNG